MIQDRSFYQHIFRLMLPIVLQQLLRISVDTVNSIFLGRIDQLQMSAVAQANQIFFVFYTIVSGLAVGCCVLVSQYWGKRDRESISVIISHALRNAFLIGLIATILIALFPQIFMRIYSSDVEIIRIGAGYLRKVVAMYIVCGLSVTLFGASRGVEQVKIILFTNILSYSINILLDNILIYGKLGMPQMGVTGVAIGTVVARFVEFAVCASFFLKDPDIPFVITDLKKSDPELHHALIKISTPIVAHEIVWSLGTSSGAMITGQLGKSAVAGYNVTTVLYDLCASVGNGFLSACSVVLGMTLGRGDTEQAKQESDTMLIMGLGIGIGLGLLTYLVRKPFLSMYALDSDAVSYAEQFMTIISFIWPFSLIEMVGMIAILRAGGDGKTGFYTDIVVMWLICIPLAAFCAFRLHTEPWVVVAIIKSIIALEAIVGLIRVKQYHWLNNLTRA
ncbi:MAG: MATE family efflux transporter [Solobacterium sp.]|nr:MATE family efflux transporter [Solobacterium sp.]